MSVGIFCLSPLVLQVLAHSFIELTDKSFLKEDVVLNSSRDSTRLPKPCKKQEILFSIGQDTFHVYAYNRTLLLAHDLNNPDRYL